MPNEQVIQGHWTELRGRMKQRWGSLTDDDLALAEGRIETLVGMIQKRTGQSRESIEGAIDKMAAEYESHAEKARRKASSAVDQTREYADHAAQRARQQVDDLHRNYDEMSQKARDQVHQAEDCIRKNPLESVLVSFGAGLVAGLLVGLCCRPNRK